MHKKYNNGLQTVKPNKSNSEKVAVYTIVMFFTLWDSRNLLGIESPLITPGAQEHI